jgi:hypothetical protein
VSNVGGNATCSANFATVSYAVTGTATGGGTIAASSGGSPCAGGACSVPFGGSATFTAGPDSAAIGFTGFSGACTVMGSDPRVAVVANVGAPASCVANFAGNVYTVTGNTTGGGTITGAVGSVACTAPATCSVPFGGSATFTAGADTAAVSFSGFTGACTALAGSPRVATVSNVGAAATCTANFTGNSYTVSGTATGGGTITATTGGVACTTASCSVPFGGSATFTAGGASSAIAFGGFSGDCVPTAPGAPTATVSNVGANATCVATFQTAQYQVTGTAMTPGGLPITGAVSAVSGGVVCPGAVCTVPYNGSVAFLALATSGNLVFQSFVGSCTSTGGLTAAIDPVLGAGSCTAIYGPPPEIPATLTVTVNPNSGGQGTVSCGAGASPANNNSTTCSFPDGTLVNVRAVADSTSVFGGWSGTGCPTGNQPGATFSFVLDGNATCTALFFNNVPR